MSQDQLFALFSDDGAGGIEFCFVGTREQANKYIEEQDQKKKDYKNEDEPRWIDERWIFFWAPIELGVPMMYVLMAGYLGEYESGVQGRDKWV